MPHFLAFFFPDSKNLCKSGPRASADKTFSVVPCDPWFETHSFPKSFAATLAALPSMSLLPAASFSLSFSFVFIGVHSWLAV